MTRTVLGVLPHPDDEAYAAGGALALAADAGARVHLVMATRGERGERFHAEENGGRSLAEVRTDELACSCRTLGIEQPTMLDLPDGGLAGADFPGVVMRLVRIIRRVRPQVLISLGADGVYGHPDHIALYRLVVAAVRSAAGGDRFSPASAGEPHRVDRVLYCAFPAGLFRPQYERMLGTELEPAMRLVDPSRLGSRLEEATLALPISSVAGRKLAAIGCHRSQWPGEDPRALFPAGIIDELLEFEYFTSSDDGTGAARLTGLFDGLPE